MRWFSRLVWPSSYAGRFCLATCLFQPILFVMALLLGWAQHLSLAVTVVDVWFLVASLGLATSLVLAAACTPGVSVWKPLWAVWSEDDLVERRVSR